MRTINWHNGKVITLDQTVLPEKEIWLEFNDYKVLAKAIKEMKMRGAPLIGAAAAYGLALAAYHSIASNKQDFLGELKESAKILKNTRPTAVNLFWAINRVIKKANETKGNIEDIRNAVIAEAQKIADEDVMINTKIGDIGSSLINNGDSILTHCNAGALATVDYGTALAVVRSAWNQGKKIKIFADETRPRLQGARLTTYELMREGIPVTLITDNMAGFIMARGLVNKVIVGADRIVQDAVINKIGTYSVAILAKEHSIPFYVAAPLSTFDLKNKSENVKIEERNPNEVKIVGNVKIAPNNVKVMNYAFDITPLKYIDGIICEKGIYTQDNIKQLTNY